MRIVNYPLMLIASADRQNLLIISGTLIPLYSFAERVHAYEKTLIIILNVRFQIGCTCYCSSKEPVRFYFVLNFR